MWVIPNGQSRLRTLKKLWVAQEINKCPVSNFTAKFFKSSAHHTLFTSISSPSSSAVSGGCCMNHLKSVSLVFLTRLSISEGPPVRPLPPQHGRLHPGQGVQPPQLENHPPLGQAHVRAAHVWPQPPEGQGHGAADPEQTSAQGIHLPGRGRVSRVSDFHWSRRILFFTAKAATLV